MLARVGEQTLQVISAAGVLVATHRRLPVGGGQTARQPAHQAALEQAVLAAFTTKRPCRRKANRPPSAEALALAAALCRRLAFASAGDALVCEPRARCVGTLVRIPSGW